MSDGRLFVCLTDAVADSFPPRCSARELGSDEQPELTEGDAARFIERAGGDGAFWAVATVSGHRLEDFEQLRPAADPDPG